MSSSNTPNDQHPVSNLDKPTEDTIHSPPAVVKVSRSGFTGYVNPDLPPTAPPAPPPERRMF